MRLLQQQFVHDVIRALWAVYRDPRGPIVMTLSFGPSIPRGTTTPAIAKVIAQMELLPNTHKVQARLDIKDIAGNPATVDGLPVWSVSSPDIVSLDVATDGLSAFVIAQGPLGTSQISVEADADLGEGTRTITTLGDVEVIASEAVTLGLTFGTPEPK